MMLSLSCVAFGKVPRALLPPAGEQPCIAHDPLGRVVHGHRARDHGARPCEFDMERHSEGARQVVRAAVRVAQAHAHDRAGVPVLEVEGVDRTAHDSSPRNSVNVSQSSSSVNSRAAPGSAMSCHVAPVKSEGVAVAVALTAAAMMISVSSAAELVAEPMTDAAGAIALGRPPAIVAEHETEDAGGVAG